MRRVKTGIMGFQPVLSISGLSARQRHPPPVRSLGSRCTRAGTAYPCRDGRERRPGAAAAFFRCGGWDLVACKKRSVPDKNWLAFWKGGGILNTDIISLGTGVAPAYRSENAGACCLGRRTATWVRTSKGKGKRAAPRHKLTYLKWL